MTRLAKEKDLPHILDIYNYYVKNTSLAFDTETRDLRKGKIWFNNHDDRHPIIVDNSMPINGWASLSEWSSHGGYQLTAELTIFVENKCHGKGIGKKLFSDIINRAKNLGYHCIISRITEGNEISRKIHEKARFRYIGIMKEVGKKFDKWLDVHIYQKILTNHNQ